MIIIFLKEDFKDKPFLDFCKELYRLERQYYWIIWIEPQHVSHHTFLLFKFQSDFIDFNAYQM
jgi:hypothetical protein